MRGEHLRLSHPGFATSSPDNGRLWRPAVSLDSNDETGLDQRALAMIVGLVTQDLHVVNCLMS